MGPLERHESCSVFFSEKIGNVTHLRSKLRTFVMSKILYDRSCGYSEAVRVDSEDYFSQEWSQTLSDLREHQNSMLVDLSGTDRVLYILACVFYAVTHITRFGKAV